jgi:hypothetical protein
LIAGNGEAPDVTAMPPFSFRGKVLTDKFAIGDLTAEEVSRLGIIDSIIAGEEKQKKSAKMDLMEFTARPIMDCYGRTMVALWCK